MSLKDSSFVDVYNFNPFRLAIIDDKILDPCTDYNNPTFDTITIDQLKYLNSNTTGIRNGLIRFNKDEEDEIYKELKIDKSKILFNEDIEDTILHPTKEKLQRFLDVIDRSVFDRIIAIHMGLVNSNAYDISNRVTLLIQNREKEFRRNIMSTNIRLTNESIKKNNEIDDIKEQNKSLQNQLEQMQEMMAKLMAMQSNNVVSDDKVENKTELTKPKTSNRGRKPSVKKSAK